MELSTESYIRSRAGGFSGVDLSTVLQMPAVVNENGREVSKMYVMEFGSLQTISISKYKNKPDVRSLGFAGPTGFARGMSTIAGTLIFNQINHHPFDDNGTKSIVYNDSGVLTYSSGEVLYKRTTDFNFEVPDGFNTVWEPVVENKRHHFDFSWDQRSMNSNMMLNATDLPPFDIIGVFVNETGSIGKFVIYGVDLVSESTVYSIEDIYTEATYQYKARDIEWFHSENWEQSTKWKAEVLYNTDILSVARSRERETTAISNAKRRLGAL
jgi:hypothetical protein